VKSKPVILWLANLGLAVGRWRRRHGVAALRIRRRWMARESRLQDGRRHQAQPLYLAPAAASNAPAMFSFSAVAGAAASPQQFEVQCRHLAERGMVAITADYRVATRQQAKPVQCVADARSAIRWVRAHAAQFGVDPAALPRWRFGGWPSCRLYGVLSASSD